jgi:hypothetical protein
MPHDLSRFFWHDPSGLQDTKNFEIIACFKNAALRINIYSMQARKGAEQ